MTSKKRSICSVINATVSSRWPCTQAKRTTAAWSNRLPPMLATSRWSACRQVSTRSRENGARAYARRDPGDLIADGFRLRDSTPGLFLRELGERVEGVRCGAEFVKDVQASQPL